MYGWRNTAVFIGIETDRDQMDLQPAYCSRERNEILGIS